MVSPLNNPFPNGVVPQLTSPPTGLDANLGNSLNTMLHSQRTPTTYNFNFGLEYELPHQVVVSAGYVGSRGLFLPLGSADQNELDLGTIGQYQSNLLNTTVPNQWAAIQPATNANSGRPRSRSGSRCRSFRSSAMATTAAETASSSMDIPGGDSEYSSLQTKLQKRLTQSLHCSGQFHLGQADDRRRQSPARLRRFSSWRAQDWKNLSLEHSVSPQDVKYQFTGNVSYDLPFGKGRAFDMNGVGNAVAGGWTTNLIAYLSTGVPIASPTVGAGTSYFNQRPDQTCNPGSGAPHSAGTWFNYNCFAIPTSPFVAGNAPAYLDHVRTMGANDFDISLYKHLSLGKEKDLRFEISCYNIANRAQLGMPGTPSITAVQSQPSVAATFGQITATVNAPRQFQFGGRFTF